MMNIRIDINVCRVCLQTGSGISLFDKNAYADKFQYSTQLKITKGDGLPETMCNKCIRKLNVAYEFRKQSQVSDQHLRSFIDDVNKKFSKVTTTTHNDSNKNQENQNDADLIAILASDELSHQTQPPTETENDIASDPESILPIYDEQMIETKVHQIKKEKIQEDSEDDTNYYHQNEVINNKKSQDIVESYVEEYPADYEITEGIDDDVQFTVETLEFSTNGDDDNNDNDDHHDETNEMQLIIADEEENLEEEHLLDNIDNTETEEDILRLAIKSKPRKTTTKSASSQKIGKNQHFCSKCNKGFSTKTNLVRHMSTHDGNRPFKCNICGNRFTQNGSLKQHMFIHTGMRPYVCEYCDRGFTQGKSLVFHMRRHTGEKPFECQKCGLNFRQKDGLKRHESVKHAGNTVRPVFPCYICKKLLSSKYSLSLHIRKHTDSGKTPNTILSKKVGQKKIQISDVVNSYECTKCPEKFTQKSIFDLHMKQHLKQPTRRYSSRKCANKSNLQTDNKNITINLYECTKCTESFTVKQDLLEHSKLHENTDTDMMAENEHDTLFESETLSNVIDGGSPDCTEYTNENTIYKCNDCDISFDAENSLKEHRNNEHDDDDDDDDDDGEDNMDDLHECDECGAEFQTAFDLDRHILADHDELEETKCNQCDEHFTSLKLFEEHKMEHEFI